jgi:putative acetyltransferase
VPIVNFDVTAVGTTDEVLIRAEHAGDEVAIADLNDAAFGGTDESRLVELLRRSGHPTVSLVATARDQVVGHILFTPVAVDTSGPPIAALGLGPMAVSSDWQRRGIGSSLVKAGIEECARRGCEIVVVLGHPHFYPRFGFRPAHLLGLRSEFAVPDEVFMAMELVGGAMMGRSGLVRYLPEFGSV